MRVIFLADHDIWPLDSGIAQRNYHLACGIAARHEVTLIAMRWRPDDGPEDFPGAERFGDIHAVPYLSCAFAQPQQRRSSPRRTTHLEGLGRSLPDVVHRHRSTELDRLLAQLDVRRFDAAWVTRGHFAEPLLEQGVTRLVVDLPDLAAQIVAQERPATWRPRVRAAHQAEAWRTRRWERSLPRRVSAVTVCKLDDVAHLDQRGRNVHVVPNGIAVTGERSTAQHVGDDVLFVGTLHYGPNVDAIVWFHDRVLPLIRRSRPSTRFIVAGREPSPDVLALHDGDGCVVIADPADLRQLYERASVVVVPMRRGAGVRIKSLEALAHGKAVVATSVAMEGIDVRSPIDYLNADGPDEFARACVRLLADPALRGRLADAAQRRVATGYDWQRSVDEALSVIGSLA